MGNEDNQKSDVGSSFKIKERRNLEEGLEGMERMKSCNE